MTRDVIVFFCLGFLLFRGILRAQQGTTGAADVLWRFAAI